MSHVMSEVPCPKCGGQIYGLDLRGKWRGPHGGYYCWRCHKCHACWENRALTEPVAEPDFITQDVAERTAREIADAKAAPLVAMLEAMGVKVVDCTAALPERNRYHMTEGNNRYE